MILRPFDNWTTYEGHSGIDFGQPRNTPFRASGAGVVTFAGYYSARGGYAIHIDYLQGFTCGYYHIDSNANIRVNKGDRVKLNEVIGLVGGLGQNSTGPHLHMDVWVNGAIQYPPLFWKYVDRSSGGYLMATLDKDDKKWLLDNLGPSKVRESVWNRIVGVKDSPDVDYGKASDVLARASMRAKKAAIRSLSDVDALITQAKTLSAEDKARLIAALK
jgi:hypothetical protein